MIRPARQWTYLYYSTGSVNRASRSAFRAVRTSGCLAWAEVDEKLAEVRTLAQGIAAAWSLDKNGMELVAEQRR